MWKGVNFSGVVFDGLATASLWLKLGGKRHPRTTLVPHGFADFFAARASEGRAGAGWLWQYPGKCRVAFNVQRLEVVHRMSFEGLDGVSVIVDIGECNCEDSREKT